MKKSRVLFVRLITELAKPGFHVRNPRPPIEFGYIASILDGKGYSSSMLDMVVENMGLNDIIRLTKTMKPNFLIISFMSQDVGTCLAYSKEVRGSVGNIIAVGQHASSMPHTLIFEGSPVDYVVTGEPEEVTPKLLDFIRKGEPVRIRSVYHKQKRSAIPAMVEHPDSLPFPKHEMFDPDKYVTMYPVKVNKHLKWGYVMTSRGCPHNCSFCSHTIRESYGKRVRFRRPSNVADEIEYLLELGINIVSFRDDNFTTCKEHVIGICNEIKKRSIKINWIAQGRVDEIDLEMLHAMKDAGCVNIRFGVESGSEKIIRSIMKSNKGCWKDAVIKAFSATKKVGIETTAMILIGSPGETLSDVRKTMRLLEAIKPGMIQVAYFTPYPGSLAYERYCMDESYDGLYHYSPPMKNLSRIPSDDLKRLQRDIYKHFLMSPGFLLKHYMKYGVHYALNSRVWFKLLRMTMNI